MNQHQQLIEQLYDALAQLKRVMMRTRDQLLGELQLTRTQIEVLMLLVGNDGQTIGDLAGSLAVTTSASTQTVETLVKRGLVERAADDTDRRIVRARLSAAGRQLAERLHKARVERMRQVFADLSDEDLTVMISVLARLEQQFDVTEIVKEVTHGN